MQRKICIVTTTRAEYGLLRWLMQEIKDDIDLTLQVLVTGSHYSPSHGETYRAIENDGFEITAKIDMLLESSTAEAATKSLGVALLGFADCWSRLRPDLIVILGDRYELLAAASSALLHRIPIAHIHGGEVTGGAIDDSVRHALTKLSHLHFASTEPYRKRIIQLGEHPANVFNFGAPGLDNFSRLNLLDQKTLEKDLGIRIIRPFFLVTFHPETLKDDRGVSDMNNMVEAISKFPEATVLYTLPNADPGHHEIASILKNEATKRANTHFVASLGQIRYLSALRNADVLIGNSSSGLIEAPFVKTPTVNIGGRQDGRLRSASVVDCPGTTSAIEQAIALALSPSFTARLNTIEPIFSEGEVAKKIKSTLKNIDLAGLCRKRFCDLS